MARSESTIRVNIPPKKAFQMWAELSNLSDFLSSVNSAEPCGNGAFDLTLAVGGGTEETKVALTTIEKPRRLVWRSTSGARWNGELLFRPTVDGTEIRFIVDFEPSSLRTNPTERGTFVPTWNVGGDLLSFKNYAERIRMEERETEAEPVGA